ncbi:MAG: hypothetical protein JW940_07920 [Polyangiaceae bacterium]|nr:hypothetical protein [Polyangiaceae bacterium]
MKRILAAGLFFGPSLLGATLAPPEAQAQAPAPAAPPASAAAPAPASALAPDPNAPEERKINLVAAEDPEQDDDDLPPHRGVFARLTAGVGIGHVSGQLGPEPGFKPIDRLSHTAPVLAVAAELGGGVQNFALAGELLYERMLTRVLEPSRVSFSLFGIGLGASLYSTDDWFVTGHVRWLMMLLWKPEIPCWYERGDATSGPGIGLTLGKEWYSHQHHRDRTYGGSPYRAEGHRDAERGKGGIGLALQGNYASLSGNPDLDYLSGLLVLTMTRF